MTSTTKSAPAPTLHVQTPPMMIWYSMSRPSNYLHMYTLYVVSRIDMDLCNKEKNIQQLEIPCR